MDGQIVCHGRPIVEKMCAIDMPWLPIARRLRANDLPSISMAGQMCVMAALFLRKCLPSTCQGCSWLDKCVPMAALFEEICAAIDFPMLPHGWAIVRERLDMAAYCFGRQILPSTCHDFTMMPDGWANMCHQHANATPYWVNVCEQLAMAAHCFARQTVPSTCHGCSLLGDCVIASCQCIPMDGQMCAMAASLLRKCVPLTCHDWTWLTIT
ncbi:hypothetical protein Acr_00g0080190 [Actinidia rufa]|uniref:Uncharacterized protein n=1 Tax=Actinidia rufa TaxID=165716 RepID=A0A7J0DTZ5_9ERIC|nr:hypothetical protein Acr_00g0080190 [Actinidia rufa]